MNFERVYTGRKVTGITFKVKTKNVTDQMQTILSAEGSCPNSEAGPEDAATEDTGETL